MEQREDFLGKEGARQDVFRLRAEGTYSAMVATDEPGAIVLLRKQRKAELIALLSSDSSKCLLICCS